jgi:hypothetical protein
MAMTSKKTSKSVRVLISPDSHIDEAYLQAGFVSKDEALVVKEIEGRELVAAHSYLVMED